MVDGMQCIITGCTMLVPGDGNQKNGINGDLFEIGPYHLVFIGNYQAGKSVILEDHGLFYSKQFTPSDWSDRRGIYFLHRAEVQFNQVAADYISGKNVG